MKSLEEIISEKPSFHSRETEIERSFEPSESLLPDPAARQLAAPGVTCYGIGEEVLRFLADFLEEGHRTLETGAGCSTLIFAMRGARHTAVTPSAAEIRRIREYGEAHDIPLDTVDFVPQASERFLPGCDAASLDLVLLDGKHAFPWPMVDWFFTADRLQRGGMMLLDDAQLRSVEVVAEFMAADPGWQLAHNFSGKTLAFRKMRDQVLDVAWHMQPWTVTPHYTSEPGVLERVSARLRGMWRRGEPAS